MNTTNEDPSSLEYFEEFIDKNIMNHRVREAETQEQWMPYIIPPYKGEYEVSSHGQVRRNSKILSQSNQSREENSYKAVSFSVGNKQKSHLVHRLVAQTFLKDTSAGNIVNHKDGDKTNNTVENLEWCDYLHNNRHAYATGLNNQTGSNNHQSKLTEDDVATIKRLLKQKVMKHQLIADKYGVHFTLISRIHRNLAWQHIEPATLENQRKDLKEIA